MCSEQISRSQHCKDVASKVSLPFCGTSNVSSLFRNKNKHQQHTGGGNKSSSQGCFGDGLLVFLLVLGRALAYFLGFLLTKKILGDSGG